MLYVWNSSFKRKEITVKVCKRKNNCEIFSNDFISLIKKHEEERVIIYCAIHSGCDNLFAILQPLLLSKNLGVYHRKIEDK